MLLHSCPDTVHRVLLRKTQTSTPLIKGSYAMKKSSVRHHPCCSGLQVQGTAISPAARNLIIKEANEFVKSIPKNAVDFQKKFWAELNSLLCQPVKYYIIR